MIAANFKKHPDAMALQLVLPFGRALVWATSRPTTAKLRAIRAARGAAFKAAGRIRYPVSVSTPEWVKKARSAGRVLAAMLSQCQMVMVWC
ncbi:hypothetical protein [Xenophilus sp. Marseille-Q4582]|uniref:hypothetical protein n=1 Tax=Xenophilus sp. Marseille-Q4582 TaxID=2866600 RepID=UPI001CE41BB6|nr:hypothetical protein [Xenophilus sp. Marseille-Q4582]